MLTPGAVGYGGLSALYTVFGNGETFDLANQTITFTAEGGPPPRPAETALALGDDATAEVALGFRFPFAGQTFDRVFVNSDGNVTFGAADAKAAARDRARFLTGAPRIAPLFADLDPSKGGSVTYQPGDAGTMTIRYKAVRLFQGAGTSTASITLKADGGVEIAYGQVAPGSYLAGISRGGAGIAALPQSLASLPSPISLQAQGAYFQEFTQAQPFALTGRTLVFAAGAAPPVPDAPDAPDDAPVPPEDVAPEPPDDPAPPPPADAEYLSLGDDAAVRVPLGFDFPFFGRRWDAVFVNADGNLTFGQGDVSTQPRNVGRFLVGLPRIAALYADLDPSTGGTVSHHPVGDDGIVITYTAVPGWNGDAGNTVSIELRADGSITVTFSDVGVSTAVIGVSRGGAGNSGPRRTLDGLSAAPVRYTGNGAVFTEYGSAAGGLSGRTVTFTP